MFKQGGIAFVQSTLRENPSPTSKGIGVRGSEYNLVIGICWGGSKLMRAIDLIRERP